MYDMNFLLLHLLLVVLNVVFCTVCCEYKNIPGV